MIDSLKWRVKQKPRRSIRALKKKNTINKKKLMRKSQNLMTK